MKTYTGIIYNSIKEAALSIKERRQTLSNWIHGISDNKSNMKLYVE